jgi:hypothetical protein
VWYAAQEKLARAKEEAARNNREPEMTLLRSGFVVCEYCGHVMRVFRYHERKSVEPQYRCTTNANIPGKRSRLCQSSVAFQAQKLDDAVWVFVSNFLNNLTTIRQILQGPGSNTMNDVETIDSLIKDVEDEQDRLVANLKGTKERVRALILQELGKLEKDLAGLNEERVQAVPSADRAARLRQEMDTFLAWREKLRGHYDEATYEEKRRALRMLGIKVVIYGVGDADHERFEITSRPELLEKLRACAPLYVLNG